MISRTTSPATTRLTTTWCIVLLLVIIRYVMHNTRIYFKRCASRLGHIKALGEYVFPVYAEFWQRFLHGIHQGRRPADQEHETPELPGQVTLKDLAVDVAGFARPVLVRIAEHVDHLQVDAAFQLGQLLAKGRALPVVAAIKEVHGPHILSLGHGLAHSVEGCDSHPAADQHIAHPLMSVDGEDPVRPVQPQRVARLQGRHLPSRPITQVLDGESYRTAGRHITCGRCDMNFRQERVQSGKGPEPHQFNASLRGVTVGAEDRLFAVGDSEVKVFDSSGELESRWPTGRPGFSVAVDENRVYVGQEGQIEIYDLSGRLLDTWRDPERLGLVTAIGLLPEHVLIADAKDRCIRRFDKQKQFLNDIGKDNRMKGFNIPAGTLDFALDAEGIIHAANPGKHRVESYTPEGELLGHFGRFDYHDPQGFPGCCNPTNVTVTDQGHVYVTEKAAPRAKVYDAEGELLAVIASDVFDPNCKNMDLAVDTQGRVYVVDTVLLQIHVFVRDEEPE